MCTLNFTQYSESKQGTSNRKKDEKTDILSSQMAELHFFIARKSIESRAEERENFKSNCTVLFAIFCRELGARTG